MKFINRDKDKKMYDPNKVELDLLSLSFSDPDLEADFRSSYNEDHILKARVGVLLAILLFAVYTVLDPYIYPHSYVAVWMIRAMVDLLLMVTFAATFFIDNKRYLQYMGLLQFGIAAGGLIWIISFPLELSYKYAYAASYALLPVAAYTLVGLRFFSATIAVIIANTLMALMEVVTTPLIVALSLILLYTSVSFMVALSAYFFERSSRKLFLKNIHTERLLKDLEMAQNELQNANKILENLSITDELTGLYNRRYFNEIIKQEVQRARRTDKALGFMMIDIDYFKRFNDTYGHLEGDRVLQRLAKTFQKVLQRSGDFVFRLGGEEFGVIVTDTNYKECELLASNLCSAVEHLKIPHEHNSASAYVTISIGICFKPSKDLDEYTLIKEADDALYQAKNGGRNRYVFA